MIASDWLEAVRIAAQHYFPNSAFQEQVIRASRVKVRIEIGENTFADLFFREETSQIDYTLIAFDERRYGMDNLGGWHEHPFDQPNSHQTIEEPAPSEAKSLLRKAFDSLIP